MVILINRHLEFFIIPINQEGLARSVFLNLEGDFSFNPVEIRLGQNRKPDSGKAFLPLCFSPCQGT